MTWQWRGPFRLDEFLQPSRGAFGELRSKGVYIVSVVEQVEVGREEPVALRRILQDDPTGTLYVGGVPRGPATTVFGRLKALAGSVKHAHTGGWVNHRGGWNAYAFGLLDALDVGYGGRAGHRWLSLLAVVDPAWTGADSARIEAELLLRYRGVFGDNPPANLSAGSIGKQTGRVRAAVASTASLDPKAWHR